MARPTRKAYALSLGALVLFLIGANIQAGWLYLTAASLVGAVTAGLVLPALAVRGLRVERVVPPVARAGDPIRAVLRVRNPSRSGRSAVEIVDGFLGETRFLVESLPAGSAAAFEYTLAGGRRGVWEGAAASVRSGFPFGVGIAARTVDVSSPVVIHPRWVSLSGFPMLEAASAPNEPIHDRRRRGAGIDFYGIREYRSGDSLRHVHWRSTARGGRLLVREYEEQPASRLGVLLDASETVGDDPETTFEDGVSCAASLALYALEAGHPVQLFCDSRAGTQHLIEPGRHEALDWLAGLEAGGRRGLARVAGEMAGHTHRRSTNVLIFPTTRRCAAQALEAIGILQGLSTRVVAVLLSAASYAGGRDPRALSPEEEQALTSEIAASRTLVYHAAKSGDLAECLREPYHA